LGSDCNCNFSSRREFLATAGTIAAGAALAPSVVFSADARTAADSPALAVAQQYARGQGSYELQRIGAVWQALKPPRYPDLIVQARSEQDVVEVLRYARARRMTVAVKGGGHNYVASYLLDGGILLDVSGLREVEVDADAALVRAQPGMRAAELCERLQARGLAFPLAHSATVPIGGYLLGGGMGWNGESWGHAACFRVRAIDVVTAAGERLTIDRRSHPDLFWAARGAGPAFCAVATRFHLEAYPYPRGMRAAGYTFPAEKSADVARWLHGVAIRRIANLDLTMALETDSGKQQCTAGIACFAATEAEARETMQAVADSAPAGLGVSADQSGPVTFADLYAASLTQHPMRVACDNIWSAQPLEAASRFTAAWRRAPSSKTVGIVNFQADRGPLPDAAYSATGTAYLLWMAAWADPAQDAANLRWSQSTADELMPYTSACYVNECDLERRPQRARLCFPAAKRSRLRAIAARYDPTGLLPAPFGLLSGSAS
jgi:FAD/FMN-containing dehydrogenase